jgi:hypothetical protein
MNGFLAKEQSPADNLRSMVVAIPEEELFLR